MLPVVDPGSARFALNHVAREVSLRSLSLPRTDDFLVFVLDAGFGHQLIENLRFAAPPAVAEKLKAQGLLSDSGEELVQLEGPMRICLLIIVGALLAIPAAAGAAEKLSPATVSAAKPACHAHRQALNAVRFAADFDDFKHQLRVTHRARTRLARVLDRSARTAPDRRLMRRVTRLIRANNRLLADIRRRLRRDSDLPKVSPRIRRFDTAIKREPRRARTIGLRRCL